jgi:hypothetical protein
MASKNSQKAQITKSTPRTKAYDARVKGKGGLRSSVVFNEDALSALNRLSQLGYGGSKSEVVNRALLEVSERIEKLTAKAP